MIVGWFALAIAATAEPSPGDWPDTVRLATVRDGVRIERTVLAERISASCASGIAAACALAAVDPSDRRAIGAALTSGCAAGDEVACLGAAWASLPLVDGTPDPAHPPDPVAWRARMERACAAGLPGACTELGWVHQLGVDTYASAGRAREIWTRACDGGDARACTAMGAIEERTAWLEEGAAGGDPRAWLVLAERTVDREGYVRACDAGVTRACTALVERFGDTGPRLARACELGDPVACALQIRVDAVAGTIDLSTAARALGALCPAVGSACEEAAFLGQGAPPRVRYTGELRGTAPVERLLTYAGAKLQRCHVAALDRDRSAAERLVRGALRVNGDGRVKGAWFADPLDERHGSCIVEALIGERMTPPEHGDARVAVAVSTGHGAEVVLDTPDPEQALDLARVARDLDRWSAPLDRCFLDHDVPEPGVTLSLGLEVRPSGEIRKVEVRDSSETPAVDRCVVDWLSQHVVSSPPRFPVDLGATIGFLAPRPALPAPRAGTVAPRRGPPEVVSVLVLVASGSMAEGRASTLGTRAREPIEAVHRALADTVARATSGAVTLETTVRTLPVVVSGLAPIVDPDGLLRWGLPLQDLPAAVRDAIPQGQWDSVFLWVPVPTAAEPALGTTFDTATVNGATMSLVPISSRAGPNGLLLLHAWWEQVSIRSLRLLGVTLPRPVAVAIAGEPPPLGPPRDWYTGVFGAQHPDLWRDAFGAGESIPIRADDLALSGRVVSEGVLSPEGLVDTRLAFGTFSDVPRGDPDAEAVWFGVSWRQAVRVARVVAHIGSLADPTRPSFRRPVLEAQSAADPSRWVPVGAELRAEGPTVTWVFTPSDVVAVRIRVDDDARSPVCREIEVYATP